MAGIPFLHNIKLNGNMLLDAKLHPSSSAPSNPGIGTIWYDTTNDLVKIYDNTATGADADGWNTISGDITGVGSATTAQLTVANSTGPVPSFSIVTGAVANAGTALATGDQIHTFVTTQTDTIAADTSGTAAKVTVTDSNANTDFPVVFHNESNGLLDDTSSFTYNPYSSQSTLTLSSSRPQIALTNTTGSNIDYIVENYAGQFSIQDGTNNLFQILVDSGQKMAKLYNNWLSINTSANPTAPLDVSGTIKATSLDISGDIDVDGTANLDAVDIDGNADIAGNLTVSGNLTVTGTTTDVDTVNLVVEDPLIKLAKNNNSSDAVDIGFYGLYDTSGSQDLFAGLFRDAGDGKFKLFKDLQAEPTTTVDTSGTGYATGTLVANIEGNVTGTADQVANNLTVDNTTIQLNSGTTYNGGAARTISAKTAAIADGGTGLATADQIYDHVTSRLSTEHAAKNKSFELDNNASGVASSDNITYTITHGMGASRLYKVEVIEDSGNYETVYVEVQRPSDTTIKIIFASAVTAGAYRALITKI